MDPLKPLKKHSELTYEQPVGVREGAAKSMNHLRDFTWWPNAWLDEASHSLSSSEIRKNAVLKDVRRLGNELTLMVEHNGSICTAQFGSAVFEDFLILLRHILLQHWGEPILAVEDLEVSFTVLA